MKINNPNKIRQRIILESLFSNLDLYYEVKEHNKKNKDTAKIVIDKKSGETKIVYE